MNIYDHLETKKWAIKFSVDAILTILNIDQIIVAKPAGGPKMDNRPRPEEDE
jgi:T-complex protein 1 subunit theta